MRDLPMKAYLEVAKLLPAAVLRRVAASLTTIPERPPRWYNGRGGVLRRARSVTVEACHRCENAAVVARGLCQSCWCKARRARASQGRARAMLREACR